MTKILELRALIIKYYTKFQMFINPLCKFLLALFTLLAVNGQIGYDDRFSSKLIIFLFSLLCAFTPSAILVIISMAVSVLQVYSVAPLLSIMVMIIFAILYVLLIRFTPKYGYVVVIIPILFHFNLQYAVPIFLGLFATPITILPTVAGVIVYYVFALIKEQAATSSAESMNDILPIYQKVIDSLLDKKQILWISIVFAFVIIAVYIVRRLRMEYAFEIAIASGAVLNVFGFLVMDLKFGSVGNIGGMILGTIFSALICIVILFFKHILDYTSVENVQFEDDDYYYYVKAVPKIKIELPKRSVKHINEKNKSAGIRKVVSVYGTEPDEEDEDADSDTKNVNRDSQDADSSESLQDGNVSVNRMTSAGYTRRNR